MFIAALVLVFRTDIRTRRLATRVCRQLQQAGLAQRATLDLSDCDRVLRVVTDNATTCDIEKLVHALGIDIKELC